MTLNALDEIIDSYRTTCEQTYTRERDSNTSESLQANEILHLNFKIRKTFQGFVLLKCFACKTHKSVF